MKKAVLLILCSLFAFSVSSAQEHTFILQYNYPYEPAHGFLLACNGEEVHTFIENTGKEEFVTDMTLPAKCILIAIAVDNSITLSTPYTVKEKVAQTGLQTPTNARIITSELVIRKIKIVK